MAESLATSCKISALLFAAAALLSNCSGVNLGAGMVGSFSGSLSFRGEEDRLWWSSDIMLCVSSPSLEFLGGGGLGRSCVVSSWS